jgi:hypothetical protein
LHPKVKSVVVLLNASDQTVPFAFHVSAKWSSRLVDLLSLGHEFGIIGGRARVDKVWPRWARILAV